MKHDLTSLNSKDHQTSVRLVYLSEVASVLWDLFLFMSQVAFFFHTHSPPFKKKDIKFIRLLSCQIILVYSTVEVSLL